MKRRQLFNLSLLKLILIIFINCESQSSKVFENRTSVICESNEFREKTSTIIQGIWTSNQSGSKYKWIFEEDKLFKSNIYSFGEIGKPIEYDLYFLDDFNGDINENGKFIFIKFDSENNGVTYKIVKVTERNIILCSKFNETIVLEKLN